MSDATPEMLAAREKLRGKLGDVRTGGKGSVRRKTRSAHPNAAAADAKVLGFLNKMRAQPLQGVDEVSMIHNDGNMTVFQNPKFYAAAHANTFAVQGPSRTRNMEEMLPMLMKQLGVENMDQLKAMMARQGIEEDVPELVEGVNFEEVSKA